MVFLETELVKIKGIDRRFLNRLHKLKIRTVKDLVWHLPSRYEDFSQVSKIENLEPGQTATVAAQVEKINWRRTFKKRMTIVEAIIGDDTGSIKAVWFNQPYIAKTLIPGRVMSFSGKVALAQDDIYFSNPAYGHQNGLAAIYPETKGLTSKGLRYLIKIILKNLKALDEFLPAEVLRQNDLPEINAALRHIHFPESIALAQKSKWRFAFEDIFLLQLYNIQSRRRLAQEKTAAITFTGDDLKEIAAAVPFTLTDSQKQSLAEILNDIKRERPMNRLLQGDVGSGKTVVAAIAALLTAKADYQVAFMAPTEVLARQHYQTLIKLFSPIIGSRRLPVGLLTSGEARLFVEENLESKNKKAELIKRIAAGVVKIVIGTHALIQKNVRFKQLALAIIDEQHRFGVGQRKALISGLTRIDTRMNADKSKNFLYEDLTYEIRSAIFNVYNKLGSGHKEIIYHRALIEEFKNRNLEFETEKLIPVRYAGKKIGVYKPDVIVNNKVIIELKSISFIGNTEEKQLWSYLKGSDYKLALLVNFGNSKLQIKRLVYDTARNPRLSVSDPRESALQVGSPHLLSMTATPIPRTLTMTLFGDLDLSLITELPQGRQPIITKIVAPINRAKAYQFIRQQIAQGRQAFVICPRIEVRDEKLEIGNEKSDSRLPSPTSHLPLPAFYSWQDIKAVEEEYKKLSEQIFPDLRVAMLHGRMKSAEKKEIMANFVQNKINIIVSTSVVEIGVDIPNASIMMIEDADRFGLAQLYQFRGRVGRDQYQSYCLLFTNSTSAATHRRLKSLLEAKNGFELAEKDLALRGPGQFLGESQTGLPDLAMNSLADAEMIKAARDSAELIMKKDAALKTLPLLKEKLEIFRQRLHRE